MEEDRTYRKTENRECRCVLCESKDKDMKEFYIVRIGIQNERKDKLEGGRETQGSICVRHG